MENNKQTAVDYLVENLRLSHKEAYNDLYEVIEQAKKMEKNSYICSKCKSQINGNEVMQQMQGSEKSD